MWKIFLKGGKKRKKKEIAKYSVILVKWKWNMMTSTLALCAERVVVLYNNRFKRPCEDVLTTSHSKHYSRGKILHFGFVL